MNIAYPKILLFIVFQFFFFGKVLAQNLCNINIYQNGNLVAWLNNFSSADFHRAITILPEPFSIEVTPVECSPTMATISTKTEFDEIIKMPLIYSSRGFFIVATDEKRRDHLMIPVQAITDPQTRQPPTGSSFESRQYQKLCVDLNYCPPVYPTLSTGSSFEEDIARKKMLANFFRIDENRDFPSVKGKSITNVIYTVWKRLPDENSKPSYNYLLKPHFIRIKFQD